MQLTDVPEMVVHSPFLTTPKEPCPNVLESFISFSLMRHVSMPSETGGGIGGKVDFEIFSCFPVGKI